MYEKESDMTQPCGYSGKILWIDLTQQTFRLEAPDAIFWRRYAGGWLVATALLLERTPPGNDPLGPDNLLIFASSVVAGNAGPGLARFTTSAKSPLTDGIGETRTEGPWGVALKACGADVLVFTGQAERPVTVVVADGAVTFHSAASLWGKTVRRDRWMRWRRSLARACTSPPSARRVSVWCALPPSSRIARIRPRAWAWAR